MNRKQNLKTNQLITHVPERQNETPEDTMRIDFNSAYLYFNQYTPVNWGLILNFTKSIASIPTPMLLFTDIETQFRIAFDRRDIDQMRVLLIKDDKLLSRMDSRGLNFLMRRILIGDEAGVKFLWNFELAYFNASSRVGNPDGWNVNRPDALWLAIKHSTTKMIDTLLSLGVRIQTYGEDALLPAHVIVPTGSFQNMRVLLSHHPELLQAQDALGRTPFTYALALKNFAFANFLLRFYPENEIDDLKNMIHECRANTSNSNTRLGR